MIQCTITISHYIINLKFRNDKILAIKHTFYICFIFPLPFRMLILFFVNAVYGISTLSVRKRGDSNKDSVYMFYERLCTCISHCIFSISFCFPFCSVIRSAFYWNFYPSETLSTWDSPQVLSRWQCQNSYVVLSFRQYLHDYCHPEKNSVVRGEAEVYNGFQVVTFSNICHLCAGNNYYWHVWY